MSTTPESHPKERRTPQEEALRIIEEETPAIVAEAKALASAGNQQEALDLLLATIQMHGEIEKAL